jgi:hypothetical protein
VPPRYAAPSRSSSGGCGGSAWAMDICDIYDVYDDPQYWRDRAHEARTNATYIRDPETRATMLGIAGQFERLARLAEQRAAGSDLR